MDLINREAAIDEIARRKGYLDEDMIERIQIGLKKLPPSVEPERKKGRWIYEGKRGRFPACRCSECGNVENADWAILGDNVNYCPNCGADMREEKEAEE